MPAPFPASTTQGGQCMGMPDVCLTPMPPPPVGPGTIPMPYPNDGMVNQAKGTAMKVKFASKEVVTKNSKISRSMGDEAGTNGGLMSGMNMGPVSYTKCSSKVTAQGQQVAHQTSVTGHNGTNANAPAGTQMAPSQTKVMVAP
jgi:hypothetical protein